MLKAGSEDSIPNVRCTVAKCLHEMKGELPKAVWSELMGGLLKSLNGDTDREVQYYVALSK